MSHEIRTPMNGILGFAELLKRADLNSAKQQDYIRIIDKSGKRLLNLINEIIDISKIESGQMNVCISDVDINKCLEDLFCFFGPEAEKKNIELKLVNALADKDAIIKTDADKLHGTLSNLIKNAIKYTKQGLIEFGCDLNRSKNELQFYVKDTGVGIPKNRQAAIFDRLYRLILKTKWRSKEPGLV